MTSTTAVKEQQEVLRWFTDKLEFQTRSDLAAPGMHWLTIAPKKQTEIESVLASWFPKLVGKNAPCVLETQDCRGIRRLSVAA